MDEVRLKRFSTELRRVDSTLDCRFVVALMLFAVTHCGCQPSATPSATTPSATTPAATTPATPTPRAAPAPPQLPEIAARPTVVSLEMASAAAEVDWWKRWYQGPPHPKMPRVALPASHQQTCLVHVGDRLPSLPLQTLAGQPTTLSSHLSTRASVVIFWDLHQPMSVDLIRHLASDFTDRYRPGGIQVITVSVGAKPSSTRETLERLHGISETIHLVDEGATSFHQVATRGLPRTFLVEADGTVAWFDTEYSRGMRRALDQAIVAHALGVDSTAR